MPLIGDEERRVAAIVMVDQRSRGAAQDAVARHLRNGPAAPAAVSNDRSMSCALGVAVISSLLPRYQVSSEE